MNVSRICSCRQIRERHNNRRYGDFETRADFYENKRGRNYCIIFTGFPNYWQWKLSRLVTKPTKRNVRPVKTQISLGIRPVWSEPSLCAQWVAKDPSFFSCGQRRLWSDWADNQADLSLRWANMPLCLFCHEVAQLDSLLLFFSVVVGFFFVVQYLKMKIVNNLSWPICGQILIRERHNNRRCGDFDIRADFYENKRGASSCKLLSVCNIYIIFVRLWSRRV